MTPADLAPSGLVVRLDGADIAVRLGGRPRRLEIEQCFGRPTACSLDIAVEAERVVSAAEGALSVMLAGGRLMFRGEVTRLHTRRDAERRGVIRLVAEDALARLRRARAIRRREAASPAERWQEAAASLGLEFSAAPGGVGDRADIGAIQWDIDDLGWLTASAARVGLYVAARADGLAGASLTAGDGAAAVRVDLARDALEYAIDLAPQEALAEAVATGWSAADGTAHSGAVRGAGDVTLHLGAGVAAQDALAREAAQASVDFAAAAASAFSVTLEGDPDLSPGRVMTLVRAPDMLEERRVITRARHEFDPESGYVTRLWTDPPAQPRAPTPPAILPARVTRTDDPARRGRVRLALPSLGEVETNWCAVSVPGADMAGARGFVALPDIGDLVAFAPTGPNLADGIVLGGLSGAGGPPVDFEASPRPFTLSSAGGRRLTLDDAGGHLGLEAEGVGALTMRPGALRLTAENGDIVISAPGKTITIAAKRINFKRRR